jgi:hypothetical protein
MRNIINWLVIGAAIYVGINWIADHPHHVKVFRKHMNRLLEDGLVTIQGAIHEGANEVASQTKD